ncbi:putative hydrolase C777.06c [Brassica napus]|nr:PREDICTED: putative hydrolase C777.06c [Brassica oleracea var. oleracea]XP_013625442.1 PREDICTED: putative hydrolase C777.06c [Brassica oleracea var. oleracea]XP_013712995.1 putative hydrolase C777.06c [Brassica napus]XP_048606248.1 putative hydrolase C777.06c [Brassica napus]KAF3510974.1 hypothetical protein F2Q69_00008456 [Brassica cretica]CAF1709880.1 unnamed protein product [Brassica napus]
MMEDGSIPAENGSDRDGSALIFLGTGCSSAVPNAMCLIQKSDSPCHVCSQSLSIPPERNPNYRGNTSLLIDYCQSDGNHKYIQIDVGKTFREQVLRWFTLHSIPQVDSIILTHEHADAVLGLDDIRSVQPFSPTNDIDPTPIFVSRYAMDSLAVKFPYLVQKKLKEGQEVRRVAQLDWRVIEEDCEKPFVASGLSFTPLPVMHGEDYVCLGFLFGEKSRVAYISDVSRFLPSTEYVISKTGSGQLDLLILDTLYKTGSHNTHLCFPQTLETIKRLSPKRALLIGMTHEFDHHKDNEFLEEWSKREGISVKLAHDGLRVPIDL